MLTKVEDLRRAWATVPRRRILIIGSGGHCKEVLEAVRRLGWHATVRNSIGQPENDLRDWWEAKTLGPEGFHVAIGDNKVRAAIEADAGIAGVFATAVIDPAATVSDESYIGQGTYIAAGAVIHPSMIGDGVIVNTGAIVSHECRLDPYAFVGPGAVLCGHVIIGAHVEIGAGAVILPNRVVMSGARVGAGAVVTHNVPAGKTVVGVPARELIYKGIDKGHRKGQFQRKEIVDAK